MDIEKYRSRIQAGMYNIPSTFKESQMYYTKNLQHKIDSVWKYASDNFEIGIEKESGSMIFDKIICRVNHAINPKTGKNIADDFKELKFLDLNMDIRLGQRFEFSDSIWIITNIDKYRYITKSCIVRRCNNELRFIHDDMIVSEPCIIDYSLKYSNVYYNDVVNIPQGTIVVTTQDNQYTNLISNNDRFIFGKEVFKVKSRLDYLRRSTFDPKSNALIEFEMYTDVISPNDDFENQLANIDKYSEKELNIVTPPDVSDTLTKEEDQYEINIEPYDFNILQFESKDYTVTQYKNNKPTIEGFSFYFSGIDENNYKVEILNDRQFRIYNMKMSQTPLNLRCLSFNQEKSFEFHLRGLY